MGGKRILTDEQIDTAAGLRERGWNGDRIAAWFAERGVAISGQAIDWHCLRVGADAPPRLRGRCRIVPPAPYRRGRHLVRPYTPEEDEQLRTLSAEGRTITEIGKGLGTGRQHNSIIGRLMTLARRDARAEEAEAAE